MTEAAENLNNQPNIKRLQISNDFNVSTTFEEENEKVRIVTADVGEEEDENVSGTPTRVEFDSQEEERTTRLANSPEEQTIAAEPPKAFLILPDLVTCDCKHVRWVYLEKGKYIPFNGRDSVAIEIKYCMNNQIPLDGDAVKFRSKKLSHISFCIPETANNCNEVLENKKLLVLRKCFEVSEDNKSVSAIHWAKYSKPILRGVYFTMDGRPKSPRVCDEIRRHLNKIHIHDLVGSDQQIYDAKKYPALSAKNGPMCTYRRRTIPSDKNGPMEAIGEICSRIDRLIVILCQISSLLEQLFFRYVVGLILRFFFIFCNHLELAIHLRIHWQITLAIILRFV